MIASSARSLLSGACSQHALVATRLSLRTRLTIGRVGAATSSMTPHHMRSFASTSTPSSAIPSADNAPVNSARPPAASLNFAAPSTRAVPLAKISRGRVQLADRRVLRVLGSDAVKYVQNLVTADVRTLKPNSNALFAAFLNQKGRFIADAFLFGRATETSAPIPAAAAAAASKSDSSAPAVDCILIDCAASAAPLLLAHLKQFKLRARLAIDDVSNEFSTHAFLDTDVPGSEDFVFAIRRATKDQCLASVDPRSARMGARVLMPTRSSLPDWASTEFELITDDEYHCVRIANGIFDGAFDAVSGDSIALECNVEWLNGASFEKGCYLGQELMARAHFTGLVRKRLVPVRLTLASEGSTGSQLFECPPPQNDRVLPYEFAVGSHDAAGSAPVAFESGAPIKLGAKSVGKLYSTRGRVAMAMMRLEHLQKQVAAAAEFRVHSVDGREWRATPYAPATWPPLEEVFKPSEE